MNIMPYLTLSSFVLWIKYQDFYLGQYVIILVVLNYENRIRILLLMSEYAMNFWHAAQALGDPSVTVEDVTPPIFPSGALFPTEVRFYYVI